jgi:sugar phosphate isomerase/epimerase
MNRRNFLKTMGVSAISITVGNELFAAEPLAEKLPTIGLIPGNTAGKWFKDNPRAALQKIAEWGYKELEFGGDLGLGLDAAGVVNYLKTLGLKPLIGSAEMAIMTDETRLKTNIKKSLDLGQEFIVCYWPWTADGQGTKIDDWKQVAENLNKGGAICKKEGIKLLYHNHDIEFRITEGQIPFDVLMPLLDPALVGIELDLYWIVKGGQSAVEYIKKYPGRYPVYHVKDMNNTTDRDFACVGSGCIDFASIFKLNSTAGAKHFIVEHDRPEDPEACVASSAKYLTGLNF